MKLPLSCLIHHEPVVTEDICIYCKEKLSVIHYGSAAITNVTDFGRKFFGQFKHNPEKCSECKIIKQEK